MKMNNKVALVTGAASGQGKAVAKRLLEEGAIVAACDINEPSWDGGAYEDRLMRFTFDVSDEKAVNSVVEQINSQTDGISVLVNCAGIALRGNIEDTDLDMWERLFAVNTRGTFLCTRAVVKNMLEKKLTGSIINISSIAGRNAFPGSSAYGASKAAVIGFTRSLAIELGENDIRVNAICPGSLETAMMKEMLEEVAANMGITYEETVKMFEEKIPLKRFQTPEDIAALVLLLASDEGKNINGESINLDGGVVRN